MPTPPASSGNNAILQRSYTTIQFGTESIGANFAGGGTYIVKSARVTQQTELIKIAQGSGLTAGTIQLIDGKTFTITVEDDQTIAPPWVGELVTLQNFFPPASGGTANYPNIAPWGSATMANGTYLVVNNDFAAARKEPGERVIVAEAFALLAAANGGGNPNMDT